MYDTIIYSTETFLPDDAERIFPLHHNWSSSLRDRVDYLTDIIVSGDGREQRRAVRFEPRHRLRSSCMYAPTEHLKLTAYLNKWFPDPGLIEDPSRQIVALEPEGTRLKYAEGVRTNEVAIAGSRQLVFNAGEWRPWMAKASGFEIVLIYQNTQKEYHVTAYRGNTIYLAEQLEEDWPLGTKIVPSNFEIEVEHEGLAWMNLIYGSTIDFIEGRYNRARRTAESYNGTTIELSGTDFNDWPAGTKIAAYPMLMPIEGGIPYWLETLPFDVIYSNGKIKENRLVIGTIGDRIIYKHATQFDFPWFSKFYPCLKAHINVDPRSIRLTDNKGTIEIESEVVPGTEYIPRSDDGAFYIGSRRFFDLRPNWGQSPDITWDKPREMVDYDYGVVQQYTPFKFVSQIKKLNFVNGTHEQVKYAKDFFNWHWGRNREFFISSFEHDVPYWAVASGSRSLLIRGREFGITYKDSTVFRRILIELNDGTTIHSQVDYIEDLPDTDSSVVWLTQELPDDVNVAPVNVRRCSWVFIARFASDTLEIEWRTDRVATFSMTIKTLENPDL